MVRIVQSVEQIAVERVDIVQSWEGLQNRSNLLRYRLLGKFDLPGVKASDTADLEAASNSVITKSVRCDTLGYLEWNALSRQPPLCA